MKVSKQTVGRCQKKREGLKTTVQGLKQKREDLKQNESEGLNKNEIQRST